MSGCFRVVSLEQSIQFPGARVCRWAGARAPRRACSRANINQVNKRFSWMKALLNKIVTTNQEFE